MRILVTGSREWNDWAVIAQALKGAVENLSWPHVVIHGGARGADQIAEFEAMALGWETECHPANWFELGNAAGPKRNQEMVDAGADVCLAFLKTGAANRGTKDCIGRAEAAGIPVRRIEG